jgi:ribosomal protein S27AE
MVCTKCGEEMRMTEKDTSSGRDIREYACDGCGSTDWEVRGPALWQILHDDREEFLAAQANRTSANAPVSQPVIAEHRRVQARSLWKGLLAWFGKGR